MLKDLGGFLFSTSFLVSSVVSREVRIFASLGLIKLFDRVSGSHGAGDNAYAKRALSRDQHCNDFIRNC